VGGEVILCCKVIFCFSGRWGRRDGYRFPLIFFVGDFVVPVIRDNLYPWILCDGFSVSLCGEHPDIVFRFGAMGRRHGYIGCPTPGVATRNLPNKRGARL
jgi:hypothetical protein